MPALGNTDVDFVNRALIMLGEEKINSLTDEDDNSVICATIYEAVRDEVLGKYPWRCLLKKGQLAQLVTAPINEWSYAYQLPSDRVGEIRTVFNSSEIGAKPFKDYEILGNQLLTDAEEVWVEYPYLINESDFPAHIRTLIVFVLAARLAEPITEDSSKGDKWEQRAYGSAGEDGMGGYFARARLVDSAQRPSQELSGEYELVSVRS